MKKTNLLCGLFMLVSIFSFAQIGAIKVTTNSAIQLGYQNYRWLGFGFNSSSPTTSQSQWSIEHWDGGLNFWKPWPSSNSGNYKMFLSDDGFVGINMKPSSTATSNLNSMSRWPSTIGNMRLQIYGNVISHGYYHWSDSALKSNVESLENCTPKLLALTPRKYNYRTELTIEGTRANSSDDITKDSTIKSDRTLTSFEETKHYGLFAQDVKRQFPNLVSAIGDYEAVNYGELITILIKGFQEQHKIIDSQKLEIAQLRQEIVNWQGRSIDTNGQSQTRLFQNNPNPFDQNTTITYFIDENTTISSATIEVRNIMGNLESTLTLGDRSGLGSIDYNGSSLTQGYYIFTLKVNGSIKDSKMFFKEK